MPTDELTLQYAYDLSRNEAKVFAMKTEGYSLEQIADTMGLSLQTVKNTMHNVNIKRKRGRMHIVTVVQDDNTRKAIADMCLRVIATDTNNPNLHIGKYTEILFDVNCDTGNTDFIVNEVLRQIDTVVHNSIESEKKAREIYTKYLELGGKKGQMGFGWAIYLFNKFRVKFEVYKME